MTTTMTTTTIRYTVQSGDILGTTPAAEYDALASAKAYAAALETELTAAFPGADLDVSVARTSGGESVWACVADDDGLPGDEAQVVARVRDIAGRLWERMDSWLVAAE